MLTQKYRHPLNRSFRLPKMPRSRYLIDPFAFFAALVGAPLLVAILGFWALLIPVVAVPLGAPLYLALGTPVLLWFIPRWHVSIGSIAFLALVTVLVALTLIVALRQFLPGTSRSDGIELIIMFGPIMAPLWGAAFGWLYPNFERDFYRKINA